MKKLFFFFLLIVFSTVSLTQERVRVMSYNLHNYPNNQDADFKKIINQINPDALVVVEMIKQNGVTQFLSNALSQDFTSVPVQIKGTNSAGNDGNDCAFYYKSSILTLIEYNAISARTRVISKFKMVHNTTKDTLIIFGVHLKANSFTSDNIENAQKRADAVQSLRNETNLYNSRTNFLVCGDFNIFSSNEAAFQKLIDQTSSGYFIDMFNASGDWSGDPKFSTICTYSTANLNTRLDMILISQALKDPGGIDYVDGSFKIFGNDGAHFNRAVTTGTNTWFLNDPSIGVSLKNAFDHLPIYADFIFNGTTDVGSSQNFPVQFELMQNYPNPFNPSTVISYQLPAASYVTLKVYDVLGRELSTLINEIKQPGIYHTQFSNLSSNLSSGIYFYQLKADKNIQTKKMLLTK
jgi:endonuclease/exonuclease/phosphatase family metal-dependent hydrolase